MITGYFLVPSLSVQLHIAISWKEQAPHLALSNTLLSVASTITLSESLDVPGNDLSSGGTRLTWVLHSKGVTLKHCLCPSGLKFRKVFQGQTLVLLEVRSLQIKVLISTQHMIPENTVGST